MVSLLWSEPTRERAEAAGWFLPVLMKPGPSVSIPHLACGIDPRDIVTASEAKSISHEYTFDTDTRSRHEIQEVLMRLSEKVSRRLRRHARKGRALTLKIRLKDFQTYTRTFTFSQRTNFSDTIYKKAQELFNEFYKPGIMVRLVGVKISRFEDAYVKDSLFEDPEMQKKEKLHRAIDRIKDKFGEAAIVRGLSLPPTPAV